MGSADGKHAGATGATGQLGGRSVSSRYGRPPAITGPGEGKWGVRGRAGAPGYRRRIPSRLREVRKLRSHSPASAIRRLSLFQRDTGTASALRGNRSRGRRGAGNLSRRSLTSPLDRILRLEVPLLRTAALTYTNWSKDRRMWPDP